MARALHRGAGDADPGDLHQCVRRERHGAADLGGSGARGVLLLNVGRRFIVKVMRPARSGTTLAATALSRSTLGRPRKRGGVVTVVVPEPTKVRPW
jgi:hypothetical protein